MRKFTTIFMAVVLCIAAITVFAFAAETDCEKGEHDWGAWKLVKIEANGDKVYESTCACGAKNPLQKVEHTHTEEKIPAVAATCDQPGLTEGKKCKTCGEILKAQEEIAPIAHTIEHVEEKTVVCGDEADGNIEYWYCTVCGYAWLDAECILSTNLKSVIVPAADAHTIVHVDAVPVYCGAESANIEYWYCSTCGFAWLDAECTKNTNLNAVKLPVAAEHTFEKHEYKAATCFEMGNIAYEYCTTCHTVVVEGGVQSNLLAVQLPIVHNIEHVAAKAPTATENGNIEYWYCKDCGFAWLDEAGILNTNLKAVILPATGETTEPTAPDTGDNAIFFAVALVAVAVAGVAVVSFKKREN